MKRKEKKKKKSIYNIISKIANIISIFFIFNLLYSNILPAKFFIPIFIGILVFNLINSILINIKTLKKKFKNIIAILFIIFSLALIFIGCYLFKTVRVLKNNLDSKYKIEYYSVMVLKDSNYDNLNDLNNKMIGYYTNSEGSKKARKKLNEKNKYNYNSYDSVDDLTSSLIEKEVDAVLIEKSVLNIINEENSDFNNITKTIYTFTIKTKTESTLKEVNVNKNSFAVYISGIDTYGEISSVSRSDVNIIAFVNPNTNQVLLISIPRDYYVQLHNTTGYKDKLTHAGIYGIDMSIQTLEDLLECKINYYLKVNFTSVIDIVDALGGLDVYSQYSFTSYSGFRFKEGLNSVDGEQALDFARTRKAFSNGDRQRGINQQALIESVIRKLSNKAILTKYNSLLNAINGKYQTNMSYKQITSLIKMQLDTMPSWNISSYSLTGKDDSNYTYTYNQLLYVMEPDEESITEAINLINNILEGKALDNSYENVSGSSYKVSKNKVITPKTTSNITQDKNDDNINTDNKEKEEEKDSNINTDNKEKEEEKDSNINTDNKEKEKEEENQIDDNEITDDNNQDSNLSDDENDITQSNENEEPIKENNIIENIS